MDMIMKKWIAIIIRSTGKCLPWSNKQECNRCLCSMVRDDVELYYGVVPHLSDIFFMLSFIFIHFALFILFVTITYSMNVFSNGCMLVFSIKWTWYRKEPAQIKVADWLLIISSFFFLFMSLWSHCKLFNEFKMNCSHLSSFFLIIFFFLWMSSALLVLIALFSSPHT